MSNKQYPQMQQNVYQGQNIYQGQMQQQTTYYQPQYVNQGQMQHTAAHQAAYQNTYKPPPPMVPYQSTPQMPKKNGRTHYVEYSRAFALVSLKAKMYNDNSSLGYCCLYLVAMHLGMNCFVGCMNRGAIRARHNIDGSSRGDCCIHSFRLYNCGLVQEAREVGVD
ncbi:1140_t:CDS:2, partial [Dentiscutata erythropus]